MIYDPNTKTWSNSFVESAINDGRFSDAIDMVEQGIAFSANSVHFERLKHFHLLIEEKAKSLAKARKYLMKLGFPPMVEEEILGFICLGHEKMLFSAAKQVKEAIKKGRKTKKREQSSHSQHTVVTMI